MGHLGLLFASLASLYNLASSDPVTTGVTSSLIYPTTYTISTSGTKTFTVPVVRTGYVVTETIRPSPIETATFPYGTNGIVYWTEPNCKGTAATTVFDSITSARNITNICISQSYSLFRRLQGQEQLDISITQDPLSWNTSDQLSCTDFIQSYFAVNQTQSCYNTPPFTCHRFWVNQGLPPELSGQVLPESWKISPIPPMTTPSTCPPWLPAVRDTSSAFLPSSSTPNSPWQGVESSTKTIASFTPSYTPLTLYINGSRPMPLADFSTLKCSETEPSSTCVTSFRTGSPFRFKRLVTAGDFCSKDPPSSDLREVITTTWKPGRRFWFIINSPECKGECFTDPWAQIAVNPNEEAESLFAEQYNGRKPHRPSETDDYICLFLVKTDLEGQ
jgi:hypothetical protein